MKIILIVPILLTFIVGCVNRSELIEEKKPITVVEILEKNKEKLTYIKNRTADDLELGDAVRRMVVDNKMNDTEIGSKARELVLKQSTTPKCNSDKEEEINGNKFNWVLWVVLLLVAIVLLIIAFGGFGKDNNIIFRGR